MPVKASVRKRRRLQRLFELQGGKCCWCGKQMLPPGSHRPERGKTAPPDLCTVEHVNHKYDRQPGKQGRWLAACHDCNQKRGRERVEAAGINYLRLESQRGRRYPPMKRQGDTA